MTKPLSTNEIDRRLRTRYDELWQEVRRQLDKHRDQRFADLMQSPGDPEDVATATLLVDLNLSEIDRDVDELRQVQDALSRLKRGVYGICQSCGRNIAPGRLEALPQAALCMECQERAEHARVRTPSL